MEDVKQPIDWHRVADSLREMLLFDRPIILYGHTGILEVRFVDMPKVKPDETSLIRSVMRLVDKESLEDASIPCDLVGNTIMHRACATGNLDACEHILLTQPELIAQPNKLGYFPIHIAQLYGQQSVCDWLEPHAKGVEPWQDVTRRALASESCADIVIQVERLLQEGIGVMADIANGRQQYVFFRSSQ